MNSINANTLINGRFLTQDMTGVQRFAYNITRELIQSDPTIKIAIPAHTRIPSALAEDHVIRFSRLAGHAWEQAALPRLLRHCGSPLLVNLTSSGPLYYDNQISTHHDITYIKHPESYSLAFRILYGTLVPRLIRRSRALITVSEFSRNEISGHYRVPPDRFHVVYNAAGEQFRPGKHRQTAPEPYFLAVSSPAAHKNFARLIDAFNAFTRTRPGVRLLIVGSRSASLRENRTYAQDSPQISYLGRVSDERLVELYQNALAFVFPSFYEGFGIPPIEAQQCGCPVLTSNTASMPEVLGDSALYFDPHDTESIRDSLIRVADDDQLRRQLVNAGFANAARYSWERSAKVVARLITHISGIRRQ